jgi:hypothetical protein
LLSSSNHIFHEDKQRQLYICVGTNKDIFN